MVKPSLVVVFQLQNLFFIFSLFFSMSVSNPNQDFTTLLAFKSSTDTTNSLISWSNNTIDTSPCPEWRGVTCDPSTHRVTKLVLNHLNLTGSVAILSQLRHLRHLSLHHNQLSSLSNLSSWPNLKHLYLSHNSFSGLFPSGVSTLRHLRRLELSYNHFSGEIPVSGLAQLQHLITLRLEFNSFAGTLNSGGLNLSSETTILDFNVSGNFLAGKIPTFLSKFPASSFAGNVLLCGEPLPSDCPRRTVSSSPTVGMSSNVGSKKRENKFSDKMVLLIVIVDGVAVVLTLVLLTCCCLKRKRRNREKKDELKRFQCPTSNMYFGMGESVKNEEEMVCFEGCKSLRMEELLKASAEMLGKGSVGTTYKVMMEGGDGWLLVVKRARERRRRRRKEVDAFLREVGGLRHRNIVRLRAYHCSKDELLLVYDYLPNGSLHSLLHGNRGPGRTPLDWTTRLKLAWGSAGGLAFLHNYHKCKLFHGHLTSLNILVDRLGNACISDAGLHQLLQIPSSSNHAYNAPELLLNNNPNRKFSQKCDVYSFGVVLLEILTGKMVTSEGETSLVSWVQHGMWQECIWEVLDFELLRYKEMEEEMVELLQVALLCLATSPGDRPNMSMVHKMIEDIRTKNGRGGIRSPLNELSCDSSPSRAESTPNFTSS